jgi:methylamine utilization protein MauE
LSGTCPRPGAQWADPAAACGTVPARMPSVVACLVLGLLLLASAALKVVDGVGARAALATYGIHSADAAHRVWAALVAVEVALGLAVAAGSDTAAYAAAGLLAVFCVAQAVVLIQGRAGAPCACFGARGRVSTGSVGRAALLAGAFAALPLLPGRDLTTEEWLGIGLAVALLGLVALAVALLAVAREVGMLRMAVNPRGALEVPHEGPEVGGRSALAERLELAPGRLGLAVFSSEGCGMCRALAPAVAALARDPRVVVATFDEVRDADAWAAADVPGSPFAVALDADGTVLAKGTFNTAAQLESVLSTAERRRGVMRA